MARHHDWTPLGRSEDPVPGDPDAVWDAKISLEKTVAAIEAAVDGIKKISTGSTIDIGDSEAVDVFRDKADDVANKLNKAKPRYEVAAKAMGDYYTELVDAQKLSLEALTAAETATSSVSSAETAVGDAEEDSPEHDTAKTRLATANSDLDAAKDKLDDAIYIRDAAAKSAKDKIHNKIEHDDVKDSFWDDMAGFADVLSNISAVLGVLALVVNCIPVIGQALSAVLGALALITGALALILHLGAAIDNGEGWDAVVFDAIGVATFGIGRAFTAGAKGLSLASRSLAWGKLSRVGGPVASRLATGTFAFSSKGPMALSTARSTAALSGTSRFSSGVGGLGADLSSAMNTLRGTNLSGVLSNLRATPAHIAANSGSAGDISRMLQGTTGLSGSLDDLAGLGSFRGMPGVSGLDQAINLSDQAGKWANFADVNFAVGLGSSGLDAIDADIPLLP
ncbi:MAG: putative T7SS-secreted protein [Aeromicrobium sp.]